MEKSQVTSKLEFLMKIKQLLSSDIRDEYLETLNDKSYMKYSRNSENNHTKESQIAYVNGFDKDTYNPKSLIFGIFDESKLIGTITAYFNKSTLCVNVGLLIFKSFASKGTAKESLVWISTWLAARFPTYSVQVGMKKTNLAMIRVAISSGYSQINSLNDETLLFEYKKSRIQPVFSPSVFQSEPTLFFATDTGGAEALLELFLINKMKKGLSVCGQGQNVFRYFGIDFSNTEEVNHADFKSLLFSTGLNCSFLTQTQHHFAALGLPQTCILDHWVNYKERFNANGSVLPDLFFVTNEIAQKKAMSVFPKSQIFLTPDFRLRRLKDLIRVNFPRDEEHVLVVLEPERAQLEGIGEITPRSQLEAIYRAKLIANQIGLNSVVVRLHPKMLKNNWIREILQSDVSLKLSKYARVEDDLSNTKAVVGLSSSVLYFASRMGIPSFTVLEFSKDSWLGMCKEIQKRWVD